MMQRTPLAIIATAPVLRGHGFDAVLVHDQDRNQDGWMLATKRRNRKPMIVTDGLCDEATIRTLLKSYGTLYSKLCKLTRKRENERKAPHVQLFTQIHMPTAWDTAITRSISRNTRPRAA